MKDDEKTAEEPRVSVPLSLFAEAVEWIKPETPEKHERDLCEFEREIGKETPLHEAPETYVDAGLYIQYEHEFGMWRERKRATLLERLTICARERE